LRGRSVISSSEQPATSNQQPGTRNQEPATTSNDMASAKGTYVYCVVAAKTRPRVPRVPRRLVGMGSVRVIDVERGHFLVVADASLDRYGEAAINRGLADLDWVARAAVAHEAVVESFIGEPAVLPMKLFTIFSNDARAIDYIRSSHVRIAPVIARVANHDEWGVRVVLDRSRQKRVRPAARPAARSRAASNAGAAYLSAKKAQRDAATDLAVRARETVAALFDRLDARSRLAKRRAASELPVEGGPLLLDAAFLVPRGRAASFRSLVAREAKALARQGYGLTVTGPWPPYSFVQD
jgi:Gas vesicle synthesis protein GvpL/GvpF